MPEPLRVLLRHAQKDEALCDHLSAEGLRRVVQEINAGREKQG